MNYQHQNAACGQWFKFSIFEQMGNIGSEVNRAINWREQSPADSQAATERALELLDLTLADPKNRGPRLKELWRVREVLTDYFYGDNQYGSTDQNWRNYFDAFAWAAALQRKF